MNTSINILSSREMNDNGISSSEERKRGHEEETKMYDGGCTNSLMCGYCWVMIL